MPAKGAASSGPGWRVGIRRTPVVAASVGLMVVLSQANAEVSTSEAAPPPAQPRERVEVTTLTTETARVFAEPDGTYTAELDVEPVRVKRGGGWTPVDTTLIAGKDGAVRPTAVPVSLTISGGGDGPLVELGAGADKLALSWPETLPPPTLDGDVAVYPNVWPGVDLRVQATTLGYSSALVVKDRAAAKHVETIRLGVLATGVELRPDKAAGSVAVKPGGEPVFTSLPATMSDSAGAASSGDNSIDMGLADDSRKHGEVEIAVAGEQITVVPDADFLADPDTKYPIVIEPYADRWHSPSQTGRARIKNGAGYRDNSYWNDSDQAKTGYCGTWPNCNGIGRVRSYFQYDVRALHGKEIVEADFNVFAAHLASCNHRELALWRSGEIGPRTSWDNRPRLRGQLDVVRSRAGRDGCSPGKGNIGFDATTAVRGAVAGREPNVTLMLKNATNETGSTGNYETNQNYWGRYGNKPTLVVNYNTRPSTPTGLSAHNKPCSPGVQNAVYLPTGGPILRATVRDPDKDNVRARFEWDASDANGNLAGSPRSVLTSGYESSGSTFATSVNDSRFGHGSHIAYRVRGYDGKHDGAWSSYCYAAVDLEPPDRAPKVSSPHYVECADENEGCAISGSPGQSGLFTFEANGVRDVVGFYYALGDAEPTQYVPASPERDGTQRASVMVTPDPQSGTATQRLRVVSVDRAGNRGRLEHHYTYMFSVGDHSDAVGHWMLDGRGADPLTADTSGYGHPGAVTGLGSANGAEWVIGRSGDALRFHGDGYLETSSDDGSPERIVHTDAAFTVSAWIRVPSGVTGEWRTIATQSSDQSGGFFLQYNASTRQLSFAMPRSAASGAGIDRASAPLPATGVWTHVAGVYNPANPDAAGMRLFINGKLAATADRPASRRWHAPGPLQIGRAKWNGVWAQGWIGDIDEVRLFNRALADDEIRGWPNLLSRPDGLAGRPTNRETSYVLNDGGRDAFDMSGNRHAARLGDGASWGRGVDNRGAALHLSGASESYASTAEPVVRTDQSFSVTAWARADRLDLTHRTVVSQDGARHSGFSLGYDHGRCASGGTTCDAGGGVWAFTIPATDSGAMSGITASASDAAGLDLGHWVHLAGVFDVGAGELRIYVDGVLAGDRRLTAQELAGRWHADGALQLGRAKRNGALGDSFAGQIACVELYTGVRSRAEIVAAYEFGCPDTSADLSAGQFVRWANHDGDSLTSSRRAVPHGYHVASTLGMPAAADSTAETIMLYGCAAGANAGDAFTSGDPGCEGHRRLGAIGLAYAEQPEGMPTVPLYRCVVNAPAPLARDHHFDSNEADCEGMGRQEGRLGYLAAYSILLRHVYPDAHWTSSAAAPSRFQVEGWLGVVSLLSVDGTVPIYACDVGRTGSMTSLDANCEGRGTQGEVIGHIWTEPPPDVESRPLYRCLAGEDYFDSLNDDCEGRRVDRELGHVITAL